MLKPVTAMVAIGLLALGACAQPTAKTASAKDGVKVLDVAKADKATITARGTFEGKSNKVTTGHASIGRVGKQWVVILEDDFSFSGAPDTRVALGNNGYDESTNLSLLSSNSGKQVYAIPASIDVGKFNEIWLWCKKFAVPLGKAKLNLT